MNDIVFIKQKPTAVARYFGLDKLPGTEGVSVHPGASQSFSPRTESDGNTWVTGLNENSPRVLAIRDEVKRKKRQDEIVAERINLEQRLGVDLNPHSNFWETYRCSLVARYTEALQLDLNEPQTKLMYIVSKENRYVAPDYESLSDPAYEGAFLYEHNPTEKFSQKMRLQEERDFSASLISPHKKNYDKLYYWCSALGKPVNKGMNIGDLYALMSNHREALKTLEQIEALNEVLQLSNEELIARWQIKTAVHKRMIGKANNELVYQGVSLGRTQTEAVSFIQRPENKYIMDLLDEALTE